MTTLSWPNFCLVTDWEGESAEYEGSETKKCSSWNTPLKLILSCWSLSSTGLFVSPIPHHVFGTLCSSEGCWVLTLPFFHPSFPPSYFFRMKFAYRMKSEKQFLNSAYLLYVSLWLILSSVIVCGIVFLFFLLLYSWLILVFSEESRIVDIMEYPF